MLQQTLSIIKPDAVARNLQGEILAMIQKSGLRVVAMKMIRLTRAQAEALTPRVNVFPSMAAYPRAGGSLL